MRIRLLGGFGVSVGSRTIEEGAWRRRNAASLVKLLALSPNHSLHREQIMDALWPEIGTARASNNLRQVLHAARRALEPGRAAKSRYLGLREHHRLVLCPDERVWVDAEAFEEAAATARRGRDPAAYGMAIDLYAGELLPGDRYEEWAEGRREELRRLYLALLVELAGLHEERDEHDAGIEMLLRAAAEDPALEEAHAGLMRMYALSGKRTLALDQYERLRQVLSEKLGIEPDASTRSLHDEIAAGGFRTGEPTASEARKPLVEGKHNLPAPRSSFVGRESELRDLKRDLAMTRMLTLTGAGGCGKTRLALEAARDLVGIFPDGVWLVELASLSEGTLVAQAVATALGVQEQPERPLTDTLVDFLRAKRALLVLDNCEHLLDAVARLADALLNSCSHLKVLATSRESPNVEGELNWAVPSLSAPSRELPPTFEELAVYESVRLFVERARHRNPAFTLTPTNADAVARICGRLEGIPLAIELAAARAGLLSAEEIAARLDDSLGLLIAGSRTASPRQRTLRGTLDWSHELLSEHERELFARLSVFAGGWTLEAAEAVGAGGDTDQSVVFDPLSGLVEKSLVVAEATGRGARYRLLEPVRQYASERLEGAEGDEILRRHAYYFLNLAEYAEPELRGPEDVEWLERLEVEHDNLRAALSWSSEVGEAELVLRLAGALWMFWEAHGHYSEGRMWLERAPAEDDSLPVAARLKALEAMCSIAFDQWDLDRGEAAAHAGIRLCARAGTARNLSAPFRTGLSFAAYVRGDAQRAKDLLEESLMLCREADDKVGMADALFFLGHALLNLGDHEQAKRLFEKGAVLCRGVGYTYRLPDFLHSRGYLFLLDGDYERGSALSEEAAALFRDRGYKGGLELVLDNLGWATLLQGNHERSKATFRESLKLCGELGDRVVASWSLEGLACISAAEGLSGPATRLFGAAEELREAVGDENLPEDNAWRGPYLAAVRLHLDEESWREAKSEGRAMSMDEAIEYALSEPKPLPSLSLETKRSSSDEPPPLTPREKELAVLIARGLTNRNIAETLVLSQHTVDKHVKNILKKLGIHSREQVASRLRDR